MKNDLRAMKKTILLKNVMLAMRQTDAHGNAIPFSIQYRTWNKQNKMGGKLKVYENAVLCFRLEKNKTLNWEKALKVQTKQIAKKNPNHYQHYTKNIELANGEIKKINILLITEFNGMEVVY